MSGKKSFRVMVLLWGTGREIHVDAYTESQALSLAKMQCTPAELTAGKFEVIS